MDDAAGSFPAQSQAWPVAAARIDLYSGKRKRCGMMLFYPIGTALPQNEYTLPGWGGEDKWWFLHAPITSFGPALAILGFAERPVSLYTLPDNTGGLDTATEILLPKRRVGRKRG